MIWQIVLLIIIVTLIMPIPVNTKIAFNILKLSGEINIQVLRVFKYKRRVRFKNGYLYITRKGRTKREKISSKNFNIAYAIQFVRQVYFRLILKSLTFVGEEGYYNNAMISAMGAGTVDLISKCVFARIRHNKKSAHIVMRNEAKYNQDCLNFKIEGIITISIFDIIYSIVNSYLSLKGGNYERKKAEYQQNQEFD